jgi:hypothetical protein
MEESLPTEKDRTRFRLSLDGWAMTVALALALAVRFGLLKHVPW